MSDIQCPYCGADQEVCHDDSKGYGAGVKHHHTCSACEKTFVFEAFISFYYKPRKSDCLNGAEHELAFQNWPKESSRMFCKHCGYDREATPEEIATWHKYNAQYTRTVRPGIKPCQLR